MFLFVFSDIKIIKSFSSSVRNIQMHLDSLLPVCASSNVVTAPLFQLNISFPATGCQKLLEVDDERKLRTFYEKRMATEVSADPLGDEWKVSFCVTFGKYMAWHTSRPFLTDP